MRTLSSLEHAVHRQAWVLTFRGVVSILLGIIMIVWPGVSLAALIFTFAAYCLLDGLVAFAGGYDTSLWQSIATGTISILAAVAAVAYPGVTTVVFVWMIAGWLIARGLFEIAVAVEFRKVIEGEWRLALAGVLSIGFGLLIAFNPAAGALSFVWLLATYAIVFGVLLTALGMQARRLARVHGV